MKKDNNKIKKIGAWIAIIILLLACCMPMIFAFGNGEDSQVYFKASLAVAIMVPIMAYAIWMVYKLLNRNKKVVDSDMENIIFEKHFITYFRGHSQPKSNGFKSHQIHTRHGCDILGNRREKDGIANLFARTGVTARYA